MVVCPHEMYWNLRPKWGAKKSEDETCTRFFQSSAISYTLLPVRRSETIGGLIYARRRTGRGRKISFFLHIRVLGVGKTNAFAVSTSRETVLDKSEAFRVPANGARNPEDVKLVNIMKVSSLLDCVENLNTN